MLEINNVFNYSVNKFNKNNIHTSYIICDKLYLESNKLINNLIKEIKGNIPIKSNLNDIIDKKKIKSNEILIILDNKHNLIIKFINFNIDKIANYLFASLINNDIRNINLLLIFNQLKHDNILNLVKNIMTRLYQNNKDDNYKYNNFFINFMNVNTINKKSLDNFVYIIKSSLIYKLHKNLDINNMTLLKNNTDKINNNKLYIHFNNKNNNVKIDKQIIIIIANKNILLLLIQLLILLNKKVNLLGFTNMKKYNQFKNNSNINLDNNLIFQVNKSNSNKILLNNTNFSNVKTILKNIFNLNSLISKNTNDKFKIKKLKSNNENKIFIKLINDDNIFYIMNKIIF